MAKNFGNVKWFSDSKGYGFIETNNLNTDVFIFFGDIQGDGYRTLEKGQFVEFDIIENDKGYQAKNLNILKRNPAINHDTEDKEYWCDLGSNKEEQFIDKMVPLINRKLIIHPKKKNNPMHIDLLNVETGRVADLKTQNTPFFTAGKYGYDPQYTVTFNRKDYINYKNRYPQAIIYWWVNWKNKKLENKGNVYTVNPLLGVWEVSFQKMQKKIEKGKVSLHPYQRRMNDQKNAKDSYLFDLRDFNNLFLNKNCK